MSALNVDVKFALETETPWRGNMGTASTEGLLLVYCVYQKLTWFRTLPGHAKTFYKTLATIQDLHGMYCTLVVA